MSGKKTKLITSIVVLITAFAVVVTGAYAWFATGGGAGNTVISVTGNVDLDVALFIGRDTNRDGVLEPNDPNRNYATRSEVIDGYYYEVQKDAVSEHYDYTTGNYLSYKAVIENKINKGVPARVTLSFSELESYFFSYIDEYFASLNGVKGRLPAESMGDLLGYHTARILFSLVRPTIRIYSANDSGSNSIREGYGKLIKSSLLSETGDNVALIENNANLGESIENEYYPIWGLSAGENLTDEIYLNVGELMEIDFAIYGLQLKDVFEGYQIYSKKYVETAVVLFKKAAEGSAYTDAEIKSIAENYVGDLSALELSYILNDSETIVQILDFTIKEVIIRARSAEAAI